MAKRWRYDYKDPKDYLVKTDYSTKIRMSCAERVIDEIIEAEDKKNSPSMGGANRWIYIMKIDDKPIYIGRTIHYPSWRLEEHRNTSSWFVEWYEAYLNDHAGYEFIDCSGISEKDYHQKEIDLIRKHQPRCNTQMYPGQSSKKVNHNQLRWYSVDDNHNQLKGGK